jgi:hypothetical protein
MEAFFLSITSLFVLAALATAICVALRSGVTARARVAAASPAEGDEMVQPRRHPLAGMLTVGLVVMFGVTLLFAMMMH